MTGLNIRYFLALHLQNVELFYIITNFISRSE